MSFDKERARVAIIGSGIAGISTAIALKRQLNFENFIIYEKSSEIGGTWRDNTYPGCASDVAGHWYSLSTDLNPYWTKYFVTQPEIFAYWQSLVAKYSLRDHLALNTSVESAEWDESAQLYRIVLKDARTGDERVENVEIVVSGMGGFVQPGFPNIPGRDSYQGVEFHSARWRHDVPLAGKRVGVIGNGCSAAQLIPNIAKDPSVEVINFCRTPSWLVPRGNFTYPGWLKWSFANVPFILRVYRNFVATRYDLQVINFRKGNKALRSLVRKQLVKYIEAMAPKEYVEKLVPDYPPGCKRIIVDPGYLKCMHQSNVTLNWDGIESIEAEGIRTKKGELIPLDVIIWATGFDVESVRINLKGIGGQTLRDYFRSQGGPTAYLGTTVPGFPNFFMLLGPNTATGHASVIFSEEVQINYAIKFIKPIIDKKAKSFSVLPAATDAYNTMLQKRVGGSIFTECTSYYRAGMAGKNVAIFPGPLVQFWAWTLLPRWEDYEAVGAEKWRRERKRKNLLNVVSAFLVLLATAALVQPRTRSHVKNLLLNALSKLRYRTGWSVQ